MGSGAVEIGYFQRNADGESVDYLAIDKSFYRVVHLIAALPADFLGI